MKGQTVQGYDAMVRGNKRSKDKARQRARDSKQQFNENYYEIADYEETQACYSSTTAKLPEAYGLQIYDKSCRRHSCVILSNKPIEETTTVFKRLDTRVTLVEYEGRLTGHLMEFRDKIAMEFLGLCQGDKITDEEYADFMNMVNKEMPNGYYNAWSMDDKKWVVVKTTRLRLGGKRDLELPTFIKEELILLNNINKTPIECAECRKTIESADDLEVSKDNERFCSLCF